jgi:hypothetical protein
MLKTISNKKDILDNTSELETFETIKNFPIYCGATDKYDDSDIFMDMTFGISKSTGMIQIMNYPTDECIYVDGPHNNAIGKTWDELFDLVSLEMKNYTNKFSNIYEIGAGSGKILKKYLHLEKIDYNKYICYEPNPLESLETTISSNENCELNRKYYDNEKFEEPFLVLHSHLLEHLVDPILFIKNITRSFNENQENTHIFAVPNIKIHFEKKYSNAIFWEHKYLLSEDYIDSILTLNNQKIIEKKYHLEHSIVYITKYEKNSNVQNCILPNLYDKHLLLLIDYFKYYRNYIVELNKIIDESNLPIYIFGAHVWTQNIICFGLKTKKIINILDNDKTKQNKRLYGTKLTVVSPEKIKDTKCIVILNVSFYYEEIKTALFKVSSSVQIY